VKNSTLLIAAALIALLAAVLPSAAAFEQDQRATTLTIQFGTDSFATQNALGGAFGTLAQSQVQQGINSSVSSGATSLIFVMLGLTDLTGTNQASFNVGVINGAPVLNSGNPTAYSGTSDLDWWYNSLPNETNPAGVPNNQLAASITASALSAGPGRILFSSGLPGSTPFVMSGAVLKANIGSSNAPLESTNGFSPGHLPSENINPALMSFATMTSGQLKGNISAASLAATPIPSLFVNDGNGYTSSNTLLDVLVGGDKQLGFIAVINPTQPDTVDSSAAVQGAGGPYMLVANPTTKAIVTCKDKNGAVVDLNLGLAAAAYSSYYTFSSDRVIVLPPAPKINVQQPAGTAIASGGSKDYGIVNVGATASLTFTILNTGNADLTGLGITIDGTDAALFTVTANPTAPVPGPGSTTFTVQFAPTGTGNKTAALHIASNDTTQNPYTINLTGTANNAPTDIALSPSSIPENQPAGTTVGTLATTDPDAGNTFTYTLVTGTGSTDNASFAISGNSLNSAASFNYQTKNSFQIRVRSTDQSGLYVEKGFTISITPVNTQSPVFTSGPTASPNPGLLDQNISFTASASSPTPVTISWDFGDGTSQTGDSVTHAYTAVGTYTVAATAHNDGSPVTQTISLQIFAPSTFTTQKGGVKFNFKTHQDTLTLSGAITLPDSFSPAGKAISVTIGGYSKTLMLNAKGATSDANNLFSLSGKIKSGVFTSPNVKLTMTLKKQDLYDNLTTFGFTTSASKSSPPVQIAALVIIYAGPGATNGDAFLTQPAFSYTATVGVSGTGKLK